MVGNGSLSIALGISFDVAQITNMPLVVYRSTMGLGKGVDCDEGTQVSDSSYLDRTVLSYMASIGIREAVHKDFRYEREWSSGPMVIGGSVAEDLQ